MNGTEKLIPASPARVAPLPALREQSRVMEVQP
jgi:hypothetical protein